MNIISGLNNKTIESLVKAFTGTTNDVVNEIKQEYGMDTGNFKNGGAWDIRFSRIKQVVLCNLKMQSCAAGNAENCNLTWSLCGHDF
ncbi:DUF5986 family protein [Heyndrickxia ginsengihumi]|uniref:DUF5986 family protein n=1 Tax=Heyndrickxia ginsengihumi TaxID=363870 RepID=UPI00203E023B|nr:DUF5986 family protein [Heyndrickxia ginsengihumi]